MWPCGGAVSLQGQCGAPAVACGGAKCVEFSGRNSEEFIFPLWEFAHFLRFIPAVALRRGCFPAGSLRDAFGGPRWPAGGQNVANFRTGIRENLYFSGGNLLSFFEDYPCCCPAAGMFPCWVTAGRLRWPAVGQNVADRRNGMRKNSYFAYGGSHPFLVDFSYFRPAPGLIP